MKKNLSFVVAVALAACFPDFVQGETIEGYMDGSTFVNANEFRAVVNGKFRDFKDFSPSKFVVILPNGDKRIYAEVRKELSNSLNTGGKEFGGNPLSVEIEMATEKTTGYLKIKGMLKR